VAAAYGEAIGREVRVEESQLEVNERLAANVLMRVGHGPYGVSIYSEGTSRWLSRSTIGRLATELWKFTLAHRLQVEIRGHAASPAACPLPTLPPDAER
jgi:hypothetical protein